MGSTRAISSYYHLIDGKVFSDNREVWILIDFMWSVRTLVLLAVVPYKYVSNGKLTFLKPPGEGSEIFSYTL